MPRDNTMDQQSNQSVPGENDESTSTGDHALTISRLELDELLKRLENILGGRRSDSRRNSASSEEERQNSAESVETSSGDSEHHIVRELSRRDRRVAELERICKTAIREREVATALVGKQLVSGAAAQLVKLWSDDFDVYDENGVYKVTSRDGRPVSQVVSELLATSEYSHFSIATSRGGTGATGSSRPIDSVTSAASPKNLGEAIIMKWREESATKPDNFLKPIGLRRPR